MNPGWGPGTASLQLGGKSPRNKLEFLLQVHVTTLEPLPGTFQRETIA